MLQATKRSLVVVPRCESVVRLNVTMASAEY